MKKRIIPVLLCFALLMSAPALAAQEKAQIDGYEIALADGLVLTQKQYWTGSDCQTEQYLTLSPDAQARPMVVSRETLWKTGSMDAAETAISEGGMTVLGGCNGGFYTVATGEPVGIVVSDGVLRASDGWLEAVGFRADGSAVFGKPETVLELTDGDSAGTVAGLNHAPGEGLQAWTSDCAAAVQPGGESWCMLCAAAGDIPLSGSILLKAERVWETGEAITVPEGHILFTWNRAEEDAPAPALFTEGAELTLKCSCAPGWEDVRSAVGILYPLLVDGEAVPGLTNSAAPRTAVGVKADGTLIVYTVDGRQSGYSVGAGLREIAARLMELGCVTAGALDGGGSTQLAARMPGETETGVVNRPSDGKARQVVNYLLIAMPEQKPGSAARLTGYPLRIHAVSGAEIPLEIAVTDKNGYPVTTGKRLSYTVSNHLGEVRDGVFYASGTGSGTITVSAAGLESAVIPVTVTEAPDTIELYGERYGKKTTSLTLEPGQEVDLTVRAYDRHVLLTGSDTCYTWTLEPQVGTVDETGHLIPGDRSGTGLLRVSAGESSVEIPITVWTGIPFEDVTKSDACFEAVRYVYEHQIFQGTSATEFEPLTVMNRAMLVTVLWRMCGCPAAENPAEYTDVTAESWYGPAVAWATETGLVQGYGGGIFAPLDQLTKEQILTILHRRAGMPDAAAEQYDLSTTQAYARTAMAWALEQGLIEADAELNVRPREAMNRAAVAEVLMRWELLGEKAEK